MAHIILTGATGQAGAAVLAHCLSSPSISRVSILSRRPVKLAEGQPKANVIIHTDFSEYPPDVLFQLKGATGCVWAQGISSRGMQESEYAKITVDYPLAAAKAFADLSVGDGESKGASMKFIYMSGEGADINEKARTMFGRIKGRAERQLLDLQDMHTGLRVYAVRPAIINPQGKYLAERSVTMHDRGSTWIGGLSAIIFKSFEIPASTLAKVCVDLATGDGAPVATGKGVEEEGRLLSNIALRTLGGL